MFKQQARASFLVLFFSSYFSAAGAADENRTARIESAQIAVRLFSRTCFAEIMTPNSAANTLNQLFVRMTDTSRKRYFLEPVGLDDGEVWLARFPKGSFAFVMGNQRNCHLFAEKADAAALHRELAAFAGQAKQSLPLEVKPRISKGDYVASSGFELLGRNGEPLFSVVASTPIEVKPNAPEAWITMAKAR